MGRWMVLGKVVGQVLGTRAPVNEEVTVFDAVADPIKAHIDSLGSPLDRRWRMEALMIPVAVALSDWSGIGGWGWPSSMRVVVRRTVPS
jgi:hypothetical protein